MRLESRSQPPEAGGKQKSRNGHQEASIHEKTSYEAVMVKFSLLRQFCITSFCPRTAKRLGGRSPKLGTLLLGNSQ